MGADDSLYSSVTLVLCISRECSLLHLGCIYFHQVSEGLLLLDGPEVLLSRLLQLPAAHKTHTKAGDSGCL
jgi:hypothetical protein